MVRKNKRQIYLNFPDARIITGGIIFLPDASGSSFAKNKPHLQPECLFCLRFHVSCKAVWQYRLN
ncbi:hypothetical protein C7N43_36855 [Sphingobacteriales bacterium UPWRP_1]|nr:hypothetical protein B6N25_00480 [Sphingobacteriales bacterium TSM_CSS]PSJ71922.1 hypothetical protein C7N43_36855 [Sphingobacteriales bacterium UPWRP_1]